MSELETLFNFEANVAGVGGQKKNFDRLKIEKDSSVRVRILPPYGENNNKMLYREYSIHWGFTSETGGMRPVSCSYPTERFCPVCQLVRKEQAVLEELKSQGIESGERFEAAKDFVFKFGNNRLFVFNALTSDGRVVILELKKTAVDELMSKIQEAVKVKKFDPTSLTKGCYFDISRSGNGLKTKYKADFARSSKTINGEDVEVIDKSPIPEDLLTQLQAQFDGGTGPMYQIHSLYAPTTSTALQQLIEGKPVPDFKKAEKPRHKGVSVNAVEEAGEGNDEEGPVETTFVTEEVKAAPPAPKQTQAPAKPSITGASSEIARLRALASKATAAAK